MKVGVIIRWGIVPKLGGLCARTDLRTFPEMPMTGQAWMKQKKVEPYLAWASAPCVARET
jgi:hypothetical protein